MKWLIALSVAMLVWVPAMAEDEGSNDDGPGIKHRVTVLEQQMHHQQQQAGDIIEWIEGHEDGHSTGGVAFQVYDDTGLQVGEFLGMSSTWNLNLAMVAIEVEGIRAVTRVARPGIWWDLILFFKEPDCAGQPYVLEHGMAHTWFDPPVVVAVLPGNGHSRVLHMPIGPPEPSPSLSRGEPWGCLNDFEDPGFPWHDGPLVPVQTVNIGDAPIDLHQLFQPPFQLRD